MRVTSELATGDWPRLITCLTGGCGCMEGTEEPGLLRVMVAWPRSRNQVAGLL